MLFRSVTEWGIYVEIDETHCEGMVSLRDMDDDFYEFDEKNYCVIGRRRGHRYQLGDPIRVQVARADLIKKQLDYVVIDDKHPAGWHRVDSAPITQQNSGVVAKAGKDDQRRAQYEGGHASRRQKRGKRNDSSRRGAASKGRGNGKRRR